MKFIEITGKTLAHLVQADDMPDIDLAAANVNDETIIRINEHGDIEVRRPGQWDVIGGLIGEFKDRLRSETGMHFV